MNKRLFFGTHSLLTALLGGLVTAAVILSFVSFATLNTTINGAQIANAARADTESDLFNTLGLGELRAARELANLPTQGSYGAMTDAFRQSAQQMQGAQSELSAAYLFGPNGNLLAGYELNGGYNGQGANFADVNNSNLPPGLQASSSTTLGKELKDAVKDGKESQVLSFAVGGGGYGTFFFFEPVQSIDGLNLGAVVLAVNANTLFGHYLEEEHSILVVPPFVIDANTPHLVDQHKISLLIGTPADVAHDPSIMGDLKPLYTTSLSARTVDHPGTFQLNGADQIGAAHTLDAFPNVRVVNYSAKPTFVSALGDTATSPLGIVLLFLVIAGTGLLAFYQRQQIKSATASAEEQRSKALTEDILNVSQALSAAREGDLTVQLPDAESEVGLISVMINGLLSDYSHMVAGIIRASEAVQEGAHRVDEGVRSIVDIAVQQGEEMAVTSKTVEALAASATQVQEATRQATELAAEASRSVLSGQEAVSRIGDAVDAIKEAAIGTTREFKHLQEDSIRLTALVASVKSNAENLDMQAANAALEARHLGTETGSAFATNIGRLARQAQETLTDAETAVRSVITSIDAVNRRIERISEQVRLGVDEVRSIRSTFEGITDTNQSLVEFIDHVAGSAQEQAQNAQSVATTISSIAHTFQQLNNLLVASSDEMASMRLVVADLQESVANLTVDTNLVNDETPAGRAA